MSGDVPQVPRNWDRRSTTQIEKWRDQLLALVDAMDRELEARDTIIHDPRAARAYGLLHEDDPR